MEFWLRFIQITQRAGKYMELFSECQPAIQRYCETGQIDPEWREKVDIALRGVEHFAPVLKAFRAFMIACEETPMEMVDPDVLRYIDSL